MTQLIENMFVQSETLATNDMDDYVEVIVFNVAKQEYCLPIVSVQEIIEMQSPTKVPNMPDFIEGIINLRGRIIPVINSKKRFGLSAVVLEEEPEKEQVLFPENTLSTHMMNAPVKSDNRIIVLEVDQQTTGLVVDSVSEVLNLPKAHIEVPPQDLALSSSFIVGIGKYLDKLLICLDPERIIDPVG